MKKLVTICSLFALASLSAHGAEEAAKETTKAKSKTKTEATTASKDKSAAGKARHETLPDGLKIDDVSVGSGKEAKLGSKITVHYKGTFKDGKEFDSSYKGGEPITFDLVEGGLIKGWTQGIPGMKVGGKRKLMVPYALGYGERGTPDGTIPPKSDLYFEVELKDVK